MARTIMGHTSLQTGDFNQARTHYDKGIALYDPNEHRPLATRFGQDIRVAILSYRSLTLWLLGYPEAALRGADDAIKYGRETGQAASLMFALYMAAIFHILCGNYFSRDQTSQGTLRSRGRKRCLTVESERNDIRRLRISSDRQGFGGD